MSDSPWQPIEHAPKDGSPIIVGQRTDNPRFNTVYVARYRSGRRGDPVHLQDEVKRRWRCEQSGRYAEPTHYMPIPPFPDLEDEP